MTEIVEQLRKWCSEIRRHPAPIAEAVPLVQQAADEIERLRGLLREAQPFIGWSSCPYGLLDRIDAALGDKP